MGVIDYGATEAGVVVMALPCLILFLLLQRHYVRGFMSGRGQGMIPAWARYGSRAFARSAARPATC